MIKTKTLLTSPKYKSLKSLTFKVLEEDEKGNLHAFCFYYQKNGNGVTIGQGLIEANHMWDERQKRPKGYIVIKAVEKEHGVCVSVMVSEEWYQLHKAQKDIDQLLNNWVSEL